MGGSIKSLKEKDIKKGKYSDEELSMRNDWKRETGKCFSSYSAVAQVRMFSSGGGGVCVCIF